MKTKTQTELVPLKVGDWLSIMASGIRCVRQVTHVTPSLYWTSHRRERGLACKRALIGTDDDDFVRLATEDEVTEHLNAVAAAAAERSIQEAKRADLESSEPYKLWRAMSGRLEWEADAVRALPIENLREAARLLGVQS